MLKKIAIGLLLVSVLSFAYLFYRQKQLPVNHGKVELKLYLGKSEKQPLVVAFGGSEGGNVYASDKSKDIRERFIQNGYSFLAVGYFGSTGTPSHLDKISINAIYDSIISVSKKNRTVDKEKIALLGGSRGSELVLNLASRYKEIDAVVALVPAYVNFPSLKSFGESSAWSFNNKELPFVPSSLDSDKFARKGDWPNAFNKMLENKEAVANARIKIEDINCPVLFISAKNDEVWPSFDMANNMVEKLKNSPFPHKYKHIALEGGHASADEDLGIMIDFLNEYFKE